MAGIVLGRKTPFAPELPEQKTEDLGDQLTEGGILSDTQFGKGLDAGIDQTQGLGGALKATVGSAIGNEEWVESGLAYYRKKMQDAASVGANVTSVEEIDSFGDFTDWAGYTLGTLVPDVVGGGVAGFAAKAGTKKLLKNKLEQEADTIGKRLAEKVTQKNYDAAAGFVGYSTAQNTASNFAEIYEETGLEAPGKALAVGVAQGALDRFGVPQRAFKRMFGSDGLEQFNDDIAERVFMSKDYVMAVGREAVKAAGVEGFTEATQEFLGRAAVAWAEENLPAEQQREFLDIVADERSKSMYINALASGLLAGTAGGAAIQATKVGGSRPDQPGPEGPEPFSEETEQARINRMPEARQKVVALTQGEMTIDTEAGPTPEPTPGTVALTPEETTIQPGQDPSMDILLEGYDRPPAEPMLYWGNMPVPLQKQLIVDGMEDDIATEAELRAAAEKLEGTERSSALNAINASVNRGTRRAVPLATQQTDEFSGDIFMVSTPETLSQKIESFNDAAARGPMPKTTGEGEFVSQGVTEADINFNITPSRGPVFMGTEDGRTVQLPGLTDFVGSTDPTTNPALEEAASIYLDLAMRGMPKEFRDLVKGTHVLSTEDIPHDADAAFLDRSSVIGMRFDHLLEGADDEQRARRNRFNTAHEVMHAADFRNGYSSVIDHFKMKVEDIDGDGQPDISMGRAIEEIFDLWESDAEGAGFFSYPLDALYDNIAKQDGDPEKIQRVLDGAREELFAQLGAAYVANEGSIQKSLPFGHSIIEDIFANPVPAEQLVTNDVRGLYGNQEANQETPVSEGAGVPRDVRTPAESGGVQVQDEGGTGGTGGPSLVEEQASEGVGGAPEPEAGDSAGQVLPVEIESVKRAEDFSLNGTMNVTMADGDVYQISRDPVARGWVLDPQHHEEFSLGQFHPFTVGTFADNRKEAEATLARLHNEKLERNAPAAEPAPRQELRDTLIQSIPEDGISAAQLSEQVGQEEANFRDLLDQMEEDGDITSELTADGERYFPASSEAKFIKKGAEYLLQSSKGNTTGKPAVTKAINPGNAAKQTPALAELINRHDDPLSSPATWLRFERDLTGKNTTLRPPHGLITLYNDIDLWAQTHSRLTDQQIEAARDGLETAREMGEVYSAGEATPDITAKLMLWGIMSRMLTASAQEAGFVDLLTKLPGSKNDPAGDIIQKTINGTMSQADVDQWVVDVKTLIPAGSFGKAGTSNANDWAKFMLKMSERADDGRSKLEQLHDLVADRSISTAEVRRDFQGMINNPGIGNKVFSFLMLMTGRDDVVILDRIQLNSMWDAGRYGKLIYDDLADEFDGGHGLARYEAIEKSLNTKIGDLYAAIGRPEDASVGRYHWESWVLNSGQVVAHPTMKGLLADAKGEDAPYADMGAPEGKMNLFRYGAIYARDPDGNPYFLYADQSGQPYRFTPAQFSSFTGEIKKASRKIIPSGFKVSEYDKGFPWYEADGVNRDNLDALIREYAEREAVESDYVVEEADVQDDPDVSGQPEAERPRYIKGKRTPDNSPPHEVSFNLDDEYLVDKDLSQRLNRVMPKSFSKALVDRYGRLKELEDRLAASVGMDRMPASVSAYDAENLMHSKVQNQIEEFESDYIKPIAAMMKTADLDGEQVGLYLLAKHAPERNRVIAEREQAMRAEQIERLNKALEDSMGALDRPLESITERLDKLENEPLRFQETGSGMTDSEAESVIATAKLDDKYEALEEISSKVYEMLSDMRQNMVDKGLLDDETKEDWQETYEFYVPLKGFAAIEEDGDMVAGTGAKGFSVTGKESFKAKGRITMPANPLLNAFVDGETKIVRAEKNVIAQRLLKMLSKFKSDQWSVYPPTQYPFQTPPDDISVRKSKSQMASEMRPDDSKVHRYIQVKRNGQDHFIEIRDKELNRNLQAGSVGIFNSEVESFNQVMTFMRGFQNFRRDMIINYNPSWGLVNPIRDVQTGLAFILAEQGSRAGRLKDKQLVGEVVKGWGPSWKALWRDARGWEPKTDEAKELAQFVKDYKDDGAPTGIAYSKSIDEQARRIETLIKRGKIREAFAYLGKVVEDFNQVMENVTRLSTYIAARKAGVERTTAATVAKDLTVNFNRKGELSSATDTFYLFFNAAIQGNVNTAEAVLKSGRDGEKLTKARMVAAGLVLAGFARTLINIWMSGEDEDGESTYLDYNEYALKSGMLFRISDEQGFALPKAYGWGFYDDVGRLGAELAMDLKSPDQVGVDLLTSMDRHFNPQGIHAVSDDRDAAESVMLKLGFLAGPDITDVVLEQAANINYFGENITIPQNPFLVAKPKSQKTRRSTSDWIESTTKTIAELSGGDDYIPGSVEFNPDRVQHGLDFLLGGVGRFFNDAADTATKSLNDRPGDLKADDVPIIRTFFPRVSQYKDRVTYYDSRNEWLQYRTQIRDANAEESKALVDRYGRELYQFETFHSQAEKQLRKLSKQKKLLEDNGVIDPMVRYEKLDEITAQQELIFDRYNKKWNEVKP